MYAAQKKCWNQRKLPRHSLIIISSFTAVDLDYTANLMPMEFFMFFGSRMLGWQSGACVHRLGAYTAALLAKERHKFMVAFATAL